MRIASAQRRSLRASHYWVSLAVAHIMALSLLPLAAPVSASPQAVMAVSNKPNSTTYNLCIKTTCGGTGIQKADEFVNIVFNRASPDPLYSGFQEVCEGSSYARLLFWFSYVHGYSGFFKQNVPGCGGSGPG